MVETVINIIYFEDLCGIHTIVFIYLLVHVVFKYFGLSDNGVQFGSSFSVINIFTLKVL